MSSSRTCPSSSASLIGTNVDLITMILICLPIKSILPLLLVSKVWYSLILSPRFQHSLEEKCQRLYSGMLMRNFCLRNKYEEFEYNILHKDATRSVPFGSLVFGTSTEGIMINQSCNGLLLCSSWIPRNSWGRRYYVYNPCTEKYRLIPRRRGFDILALVSLAFDPSKSPLYKVISLWERQRGYQIEIYSSQTSSLKICRENVQIQVRMPYRNGVYWNGSLNWLSDQGTLVYFDADLEVIKHLAVMPYLIDGRVKMVNYFDVCKGHLQLIVKDIEGVGSLFDLMEMDTGYTGWTLKYRLDLETGLRASYPVLVGDLLKCKVLMYDEVDQEMKGSPKLLVLIDSPIVHGVISYDINSMQFNRVEEIEQPCIFPGDCTTLSVRLHHYTGSLARV